jgi:hypothetical protein
MASVQRLHRHLYLDLDKRLARENRARRQLRFSALATAVRREITARFKQERSRNPHLNWNDFLAQELG